MKKLKKHFSFSSGFTVVEIIVAAALFLIFSSGAIAAVIQAFDANRTASEETIANQYTTEGIEAVRSIRNQSYATLASATGWSTGVSKASGVWMFTGNGTNNQFGKYTRVITVANVYRDTCGTGNIVTSGGQLDSNTMKLTSTVTWNVSPTRNDSVIQTTYLTNWHATINWYQNWQYRKKITISNTQVSGGSDVSNFPVLINFATGDSDLQANAQTNGNDILFTDSSGTNKLNHEIEKYNASNGSLQAWVNVPTLSSSICTVLYMYYGNSTAPNQQNKTSTWNNSYMGVWHLDEPTGNQNDSTTNANNITSVSVSAQGIAGKIDNGADQFTAGSGNNATAPNNASLLPANMTLQIWFNVSSFPASNNYTLIVKQHNAAPWNSYFLYVSPLKHLCFAWLNTTSTNYSVCGNTTLSTNTWYSAAGEYNGSLVSIFLNGNNDSGGGTSTTGSVFQSNAAFMLGQSNSSFTPGGMLNEVRLSNNVLTPGWLTTEYNNQNSPSTFYTVSTAQGQ